LKSVFDGVCRPTASPWRRREGIFAKPSGTSKVAGNNAQGKWVTAFEQGV
jgi:hypothetical protein